MIGLFLVNGVVAAEISGGAFEHPDVIWLEDAPTLMGAMCVEESREFFVIEEQEGPEVRSVLHAT